MRQQGESHRGGRNARSCRPTLCHHQAASPSPAPPSLSAPRRPDSRSISAANLAALSANSRANSTAASLTFRSVTDSDTVVDPHEMSRIGVWSS